MNHLDKSKAALESCDGWPVNGTTDMALLAIANALVTIAEQGAEIERTEDKLNSLDDSGAERSNNGVTRWHELFGTPERAARTWIEYSTIDSCADCPICHDEHGETCELPPKVCAWVDEERGYEALLEWLRGEA